MWSNRFAKIKVEMVRIAFEYCTMTQTQGLLPKKQLFQTNDASHTISEIKIENSDPFWKGA